MLELVIVIALIGILAGVIARTFLWGMDIFDFVFTRKDLIQSSRIGMERLTDELRAISSSSDILSASKTELSFNDSGGNTVTYQFSNGNLIRNGQKLVEGLTSFSFSYYDVMDQELTVPVGTPSDIWKIHFELAGTTDGHPFSFEMTVVPRTF